MVWADHIGVTGFLINKRRVLTVMLHGTIRKDDF